jgi:hypothetical protein
VNVVSQQPGGEWDQTDGAQEPDVNPREIAIGAAEVIKLGLPADPEDAEGQDAHQKKDDHPG